MGLSIAQANEILQKDYLPGFVSQINEQMSYFYKLMEQKEIATSGSDFTFLATYGRSGGVGMISETGDLPTPNAAGRKQISATVKDFGARFAMSEKLMRASSVAAFVDALDLEMKELQRDSKDNYNVQMFGNGSGVRATVTAISTTSATITVDSAQYLFPNQIIDIIDESDLPTVTKLKTGAKIINVDRKTGAVTIDSTVTVAVGDIVAIANSYLQEITGLKAIMTKDNTIYGLNRANNKWFNPNVLTASSSVLLDDDLMEQALQEVDFESGKEPDVILSGYKAYRVLKNYLSQFQRFTEMPTRYDAGHKTMSYNGIAVERDKYQTTDVMDFLNMETFKFRTLGPMFDWMNRDGSIFRAVANKPQYEATLLSFAEIQCDHPASNCRITGIDS